MLEWEKRWKEARGGRVDVAELCRTFGVSRQTGYVWLRRFQDAGHDVRALEDRSRRPHTSPTAVPVEMRDFIVQMRKQRPRWGPRALRAWLVDRHPGRQFPSASTFALILERNGLTTPRRRRRRRRVPQLAAPLGVAAAPNAIWCIDFKGDFCTADGIRCYPLTVVDAFSRYCVRCEALVEPTGRWVEHVLDSAFREFGLPAAIRSDNGPPFAASGPAGLSAVAVWLLRPRDPAGAHRSWQASAERTAGALPPHAQGGDGGAAPTVAACSAAGLRPVPTRVQRGAPASCARVEDASEHPRAVESSLPVRLACAAGRISRRRRGSTRRDQVGRPTHLHLVCLGRTALVARAPRRVTVGGALRLRRARLLRPGARPAGTRRAATNASASLPGAALY